MKQTLIIIMILAAFTILPAQTWKLDSNMSMTLSQSAFSDNWAGTELSNITWVANSTTTAEKQLADWLLNKNTLKLAFGQTHNQKTDEVSKDKYWEKPEKTTDKIDLESMLRFTTNAWVDPFLAGRFESQFLDLSQPETRLVNPMLFTETAGVIRSFIDEEHQLLTARLGAAFRENIDRDVLIGTEKETQTTVDGGLEMVSEYTRKVKMPLEMDVRSRLQLYQAIFNSKSDDLNEDWKSLDMVWDNVISTKLFGMVSANLIFELRYDKEQVSELQWKEMIGLGLSHSFF
ncbi:MAG: DUF3078 domain-containing protein [Candidatus Cloacimonetes bacterium]|jgi:hypothetical protein|nr:DUF3078 domain-containing protein [Candidatus Cloacimonadota bacterium]MCB5286926.1 DUF3078 domain-containing protein [Candidatus Cloacimonadota bacterium]MCK9184132.1 DUF3078 domain-containing protein [Candidatus Cloacimonadota bacterium]MDY0229247.1 DUF3078 domain-containing protein [Candidatus Cloacimonadaceae bacterium]